MDSLLSDAYLPVLMVITGIAVIVVLINHMRNASDMRMMRMMERVGLDPTMATRTYPQTLSYSQTEAILKRARCICRDCQKEGYCEQWLIGAVEGDNSFCPNAQTFCDLAKE
ncbi:MAG: DUF6455 family protein [Gammaproteobacteria bacterium]|jgi:hypothetical protein|nr:DUF6455 family protein [Gammaproteobacteria bacterium]MDP7420213.1 DUF6455 family protein [Gammaproteobacteria bacterium]HJP39654.1 DUF6455 family protein [Gammaproteobacteria bacterium]